MGCRVDYAGPKGITPLMWAAKRGHIEMAELLLQNGAKLLLASEDDLGKQAKAINEKGYYERVFEFDVDVKIIN